MGTPKKVIISLALAMLAVVSLNASIGKGSSPKGEICYAEGQGTRPTFYVAIGKQLSLSATGIEDKDCYDDSVTDEIEDPDGIKWEASVPGFVGDGKGMTVTWKAPTSPVDVTMKLTVDDLAEADNTTDDTSGFMEVDSVTIKVVKPNAGSNVGSAYARCGIGGRSRTWDITAGHSSSTVDFSGLLINEASCTVISNGCGFSGIHSGSNNSSADHALNSQNTAVAADITAYCSNTNWVPKRNCDMISTCDWSIKESNGSYHNWSRWNYRIAVPSSGGTSYLTYDRSWNSPL